MYNRPRKSTLTECWEFPPPPSSKISGPCRLFIVVVRMLRFTTTHPLLPWILSNSSLSLSYPSPTLVRCLHPSIVSCATVKMMGRLSLDRCGWITSFFIFAIFLFITSFAYRCSLIFYFLASFLKIRTNLGVHFPTITLTLVRVHVAGLWQ